jgi:DNA N-6-adenine-methyltransferase (Dam)
MPKSRLSRLTVKTGVFNTPRQVENSRDAVVVIDGKKHISKAKPLHMGKVDNNEVETPEDVSQELREEFGEMFDPCPYVGKGKRPDFDGLTIPWKKLNYVNPPYNDIEPWFAKALKEWEEHRNVSVFLIPVRAGTVYWKKWVWLQASAVRFIAGRIIFKGYKTPPPHNLAIVIFGNRYPQARVRELYLHKTDYAARSSQVVNMTALRGFLITDMSVFDTSPNGRYLLHNMSHAAAGWLLLCSYDPDVFMREFKEGTLPLLFRQLLLPFYFALLQLDLESGEIADFGPAPDSAGKLQTLPEMLRCLSSEFLRDPERLAGYVRNSVFGELEMFAVPDAFRTAVSSFYEAYSFCVVQHVMNALRLPYQKYSQDRKFSFITT